MLGTEEEHADTKKASSPAMMIGAVHRPVFLSDSFLTGKPLLPILGTAVALAFGVVWMYNRRTRHQPMLGGVAVAPTYRYRTHTHEQRFILSTCGS